MNAMIQTYQEAERVFTEWITNYAPKDLIHSDHNQALLAEHIRLHFGGLVSITNLNAAVAAMPELQRTPKKSADQIETEFRARELQRRQREAIENSVDWMEANKQKTDKDAKKKEFDKQQEIARNAINTAIESYECYRGPGRRDYSLMDKRKDYLRALAKTNAKADQVKLLDLIRKKILEFPEPNERMR